MPRGDRTGPEGRGPMTGRRAGYCAGNDVPGCFEPGRGYARRPFGRGRGNRGGGRGWRNWFYATGVPGWARFGPQDGPPAGAPSADAPTADEAESLKAQAEWLRGELDAIDQRLRELDNRE